MVTDFRAIGKHYTSFMFWMDLLFWFPFVSVILTAWPELAEGPECELEIPHCGLSVGYYVGLLGFLKASGTNCQGGHMQGRYAHLTSVTFTYQSQSKYDGGSLNNRCD